MFELFSLTKRRFVIFIFILIGWNYLQWWILQHHWFLHRHHIDIYGTYFTVSYQALELFFGHGCFSSEGFLHLPDLWVCTVILIFWIVIWYILACVTDFLIKKK